jgi:hypothetical protein
MESRAKEIFKISCIVGGNIGNLGALAGYVILGSWDMGGKLCRQLITDFVGANLDVSTSYPAFINQLANTHYEVLAADKIKYLPAIRNIVRANGSGIDVMGIACVFERAIKSGFQEITNETIKFYYNKTQSGLLSVCTNMLSPQYITPLGYAAGAVLGFTVTAGYLYFNYNETKPVEATAEVIQQTEIVEACIAVNPEVDRNESLNISATLFAKRPDFDRTRTGSIIALREKYGKSCNMKDVSEEARNLRLNGL